MYKLETTLNYGLERVWCIAQMKGSNDLAIGYDEGSVMVKVGVSTPPHPTKKNIAFVGSTLPTQHTSTHTHT